jgi:GT2 family glycosyltransferase
MEAANDHTIFSKTISVVIPNYNGHQLLLANLPPLVAALTLAKVEYEIIIVDDFSKDNSIAFLQENYPEIVVIKNDQNLGFSPTINKGIFAAKCELVFLMNSDVQLTGDYFTSQFKYFQSTETFGVMGRIIGVDNDKIQDAGKIQDNNYLKIGGNHNVIPQRSSSWFATFYLSGANALVDRKKLVQLRGFDNIYAPFYGEDLDLSLRAWKVGWNCYYEHQSICRHPNSVTIIKYNKKAKIKTIVYRNRFIFHAIHLSGIRIMLWHSWITLQLIFKTLTFNFPFLNGYLAYLKLKKPIRNSKKQLVELGRETGKFYKNEVVFNTIKAVQNQVGYTEI